MSQPRPSGGGAAVWGGITGTLTDQADLVAALALKGNLAGGNIWTGNQTVNTGRVIFDTDASVGWSGVDNALTIRNAANSAYVNISVSSVLAESIVSAEYFVRSGDSVFIVDESFNVPGVHVKSAGFIGFHSGAASHDAMSAFFAYGGAAAKIQMGVDSATPIDQLFKGPNGVGTDIQGGDLRIGPGQSTGGATPAVLVFQGTTPGSSGSSAQTLTDHLEIGNGFVKVTNSMNFQLANTAQLEGIVGTHALILYDDTGTAYKIPCVPA